MGYIVRGLPVQEFRALFGLGHEALRERGVVRQWAAAKPSYPCRITLQDAEPGESLLLLAWEHQDAGTPYRSGGPIFVRESATATFEARNHIPEQQRSRLLSLRAYDEAGWMHRADVVEGTGLESLIGSIFADPKIEYLHVHNAPRGCYACRIDRG